MDQETVYKVSKFISELSDKLHLRDGLAGVDHDAIEQAERKLNEAYWILQHVYRAETTSELVGLLS